VTVARRYIKTMTEVMGSKSMYTDIRGYGLSIIIVLHTREIMSVDE